ncbi:hypothetical protein BGZ74_004839 [Mortierella antarctica]|nr:hypothetical protein BGZ74_004839 [Mortierella antarctica]
MTKRKNTRRLLNLFCLVEGEAKSNAFSIEISSDRTVDDLKNLIKAKKKPEFDDIAADKLTLSSVLIPNPRHVDKTPVMLETVMGDKEVLISTDDISDVFADQPPKKTIHIIVQRPSAAPKRDREEDEGECFALSLWGVLPRGSVLARTRL